MMGQTRTEGGAVLRLASVWAFLFQTLLATVGIGAMLAFIALLSLQGVLAVPSYLSSSAGEFLLVAIPALILGFLFNAAVRGGQFGGRSGTWVWILPTAWFLVAVVWDAWDMRGSSPPWGMLHTLWAMYVSGNAACGGGDEAGLVSVFATAPMLASLAYSLGAWLALRRKRRIDSGVAPAPSP